MRLSYVDTPSLTTPLCCVLPVFIFSKVGAVLDPDRRTLIGDGPRFNCYARKFSYELTLFSFPSHQTTVIGMGSAPIRLTNRIHLHCHTSRSAHKSDQLLPY